MPWLGLICLGMEDISWDQINHLSSLRRVGLPWNKLPNVFRETAVRKAARIVSVSTISACDFACILGILLHAVLKKNLIHLLFDTLFM